MHAFHRLILLAGLASAACATAEAATYRIDPNHSTIVADWDHFGFSRTVLQFTALDGQLSYDPADVAASRVEVRIPISGLLTGVPDFGDHLASSQFFDAAKHADARFASTRVTSAGSDRLTVHGNLTIKGITRPVTLDVRIGKAASHPMARRDAIGFVATTTVRRSDFDMGAYAPNVGDEVSLRIHVEAIVPAPQG